MPISPKSYRAVSLLCALVVGVLLSWGYWDYSMMGFPDGGMTEFLEVQKRMYEVFGLPVLLLGLGFVQVCFSKEERVVRRFLRCLWFMVGLMVLFWGQEYYFGLSLDTGMGG